MRIGLPCQARLSRGRARWYTGDFRFRMRSQVQVLAGPPLIPAGHSAAGSEPKTPAAGLGRAGAAPHPRPGGHPDRPAPRPPPTVVATQPEDDSHAAGAASSRRGLLLRPRRRRQPRTLPRRPGLPGRSAGMRGCRHPHQPGPGPPPTPLLTKARARRRRPSPGASRPATQPPEVAAATDPRPVAVVTVACRLDLVPNATAGGGRRRTRPARRGRTGDGWTPDG
jgi:hypothetical protein